MQYFRFLPDPAKLRREARKTILATLKPTALLEIFGEPQLRSVAHEVEDTIIKIMQQAAG